MFKVESEQINTIKPWMILGNTDWVYWLGTIISVPMLLWGVIVGFLHRNWFSFVYLTVALLLFAWMVPKFFKIRNTIISKFGSDDWEKEIVFNDNEIVITETGSKGSYTERRKYEEIIDIREDKEYIVLKMIKTPHISFQKKNFVQGTWEDCKGFINGKRRLSEISR